MENNNALYNRIKKNQKLLKHFLKTNQITCYRIFDWDMPEYPLCVDVYEKNIHIYLYKTKHNIDEISFNQWIVFCTETIKNIFEIEEKNIFIKNRERKKITGQYEKINTEKKFDIVHENGFKFLVNMQDYLDTGLFLDHRNLRKKVMDECKGKHVLNLFAYTGSFSVYSALGGAFTTTTVDLSNTYLNWAKENFKINNIPLSKHQFIKADVKEWIKQTPNKLYDIIILDPPTLSKSKMSKTDFDVQADHVELINHCLKHLQDGGVLYFSNNYRNFILDEKNIETKHIKNISDFSVPLDFKNKKIHACWQISK